MTNPSTNRPGRASRRRPPRGDLQGRIKATRAELDTQLRTRRAQFDDANEKIRERTGRNLVLAIVIGLILGGLVLVSLVVLEGLFLLVAGTLIAFAAFELTASLRFAGRRVPRIGNVIAAIAISPACFFFGSLGQWVSLVGGIVFLAVWKLVEQLLVPRLRVSMRTLGRDILASVFIQIYVVFLGSFAVLLVVQDAGQWWTLAFLILVIAIDTGAYASGLLFGKHAMAPRISPKKTWEGFAGSAIIGVVAGVLLSIFMLHEPWWFGVIFAFTMVATATLGDLTESLIKRDLGIKDMSTWLPGHGGLLDRFDSILPSAAAAYALFLLFG